MKTVASLVLLAAPLLFACNSTRNPPSNADLGPGHDIVFMMPQPDLAPPADLTAAPGADLVGEEGDAAKPADLARPRDLIGVTGCHSDADCRLFPSYCSDAPCACIPLRKTDPDPVCNGNHVNCLMDPCLKFHAVCDVNSGKCLAQ